MFKFPALKLGKKEKGLGRMFVDPLGIGIGDMIFGEPEGPDYSSFAERQDKAIEDGAKSIEEFAAGGPAKYSAGDALQFERLGPAEKLGASELSKISTDPRYKDAELAALKSLEEQSKEGMTAQDRADAARIESQVNRANRGRLGAIQQNMQARGAAGSGMDMVAQMQSAQDAAEIEAMRALEREANIQNRKTDATAKMGSLASSLQGRDFGQQASVAQAQDAINRFNVQNTNDVSRYNNTGSNQTNAANWQRGNQTTDRNSDASYNHRKNTLDANQNLAGMRYNYAVDQENTQRMGDAAAEERASGKMGALGGIAGGIIGGVYGGKEGAATGYQVGSGAGRSAGGNAYRNFRSDKNVKKNIVDEHPLEIEAFLDAIKPKAFDYKEGETGKHGVLADDLVKTSIGRGMVEEDQEGVKNIKVNDAISALLQAVAHLNRKVK